MTYRTRTRDNVVEFLYNGNGQLCNGSPTGVLVDESHDVFSGEEETTVDVVTPNFHERQARGEIINNYFRNIKTSYNYGVTGWRVDRVPACSGSNIKFQTGTGFYSLGPNKQGYLLSPTTSNSDSRDGELASLKALVSTRALAGVVPADVDLLVDLYEWKQTLRLIGNPVRSLYNYILRVRGKRSPRYWKRLSQKQQAIQLIEDISSKWLAYRYGIVPLCLSIQGGIDIIRKPQTSPRITSRSSGSTVEYTDTASQTKSGTYFNSTLDKTTISSGSVRAYVLYEHEMTLVERSGLHLSNLPNSIWEAIPFSFVADWFLNLGDWIRAVTPKAGVKTLATGVTVERRTYQRVDVTGTFNGVTNLAGTLKPDGFFDKDQIDKVRNPGIQATLSSKLPTITFETQKDWVHLIDAITLVTSKLDYR